MSQQQPLPPAIFGRWKVDKTENLEEWMKAVGVSPVARKVAAQMTVWEEWYERTDSDGAFKVITKVKDTNTTKFAIGVEFIEQTIDGRKLQSCFFVEDNRLILRQKAKVETYIIREVVDGKLICTFHIGDKIVSRRTFCRDTKEKEKDNDKVKGKEK